MYDSDREYLSRFALDPSIEYGGEDLFVFDFSDDLSRDDEIESFDDENILDTEDDPPEDDFPFEN